MTDPYKQLREALSSGSTRLQHFAVAEEEGLRWMTGRKLPPGLLSIELYGIGSGHAVRQCVAVPEETITALLSSHDAQAAEIERLREALLWQPIETAPKDGTEVFVYVPGDSLYPTAAKYDTKERFQADYGDPEYMEEGWRWSFGYPADFHEEVIHPTHWMPLPPAPDESPA